MRDSGVKYGDCMSLTERVKLGIKVVHTSDNTCGRLLSK